MTGIEAGTRFTPVQVKEAFTAALPNAPAVMDSTPFPQYNQAAEIVAQPMMFLPGPEQRASETNWSLLPTAKHEGKHAMTLYKLGYGSKMEYITVEPHGNILGEVSISGHIPIFDFATVAAASSSSLFNDSPSGTGMDRFLITASGQSFNQHLNRADGILSNEPPQVMEKVFEIIAFLKTVDGSQFPAILEQAWHEYDMESKGAKNNIQGKFIATPKPRNEKGIHTKIIHVSPDHYKGQWLENGKIIKEVDVIKCPNCGMFHAGECPAASSNSNPVQKADWELSYQNETITDANLSPVIAESGILIHNWPKPNESVK